MPLIGFQFKYNYRAKILDVFEVYDFGDFTKALYNKSFVLLENEIDKLLLTRTKCHVNVINGVRYNGIDEIPLYRIMEYGEIYNNIYRNPRVKCGYKFNQKPSTYNPVDDMLEFRTNIMKWKDKLVCDFRHRGLKCSI